MVFFSFEVYLLCLFFSFNCEVPFNFSFLESLSRLKFEILHTTEMWKLKFFLYVAGKFVPGVYTLAVSEALPDDMQVCIFLFV